MLDSLPGLAMLVNTDRSDHADQPDQSSASASDKTALLAPQTGAQYSDYLRQLVGKGDGSYRAASIEEVVAGRHFIPGVVARAAPRSGDEFRGPAATSIFLVQGARDHKGRVPSVHHHKVGRERVAVDEGAAAHGGRNRRSRGVGRGIVRGHPENEASRG